MSKTETPSIRFRGFDNAWEQRKFSDVVTTRRGLTYKPSDIRKNGVRVLRSSNIAEDSFTLGDEDVFVVREAVNIDCARANDILITAANGSSRLVGKHTIITGIPEESAVHGGFMLLGTTKEPHFVNASMGSSWYRRFIELFVAGGNGAIGNLSKNDLDNQEIAIPSEEEQKIIGSFFHHLDNLITLHQRKFEKLTNVKKSMLEKMFPKDGADVPEVRFKGFTGAWKRKRFSELYESVIQKNDLTYGVDKNITVASMQYRPDIKVTDIEYLRTYNVLKLGDIAFEGHQSKEFRYGRFVENDIGDGIVSHIFAVFRSKTDYDLMFWKYAINNERIMRPVLVRCTKASTMMNDLVSKDFLEESILVPDIEEQKKIGTVLSEIDRLISLQQEELKKLQSFKKALLEKMFV